MAESPVPGGDTRLAEAIAFAVRAHGTQLRKDGRTPYIVHPIGVLRHLAADLGYTEPEVLAAAVLHDVLEDTPTRRDELAIRFGDRVTTLVEELTVPPAYHGPSVPDERKTEVLVAAIGRISWPAVLIKLCDRWDNLRDLANAPWTEAKRSRYRSQTLAVLAALDRREAASPPGPSIRRPISAARRAIRALVEDGGRAP